MRNLAKIDLRRTDYPLPPARISVGRQASGRRDRRAFRTIAEAPCPDPGAEPRPFRHDRRRRPRDPGAKHLGASEIVVSSRGLREGLRSRRPARPPPRRNGSVRSRSRPSRRGSARGTRRPPSVAPVSRRTCSRRSTGRRPRACARCAARGDPARHRTSDRLLRPVRARRQHRDRSGRRRVLHADLGALTAILRQADDDTRLGPHGRLVPDDVRPAVLRAATALTSPTS